MGKRVRKGWRVLASGCGGAWLHVASGWRVQHCGHPTALWPYYMQPPGQQHLAVVSHNGMGFTSLRVAQQVTEELVAGTVQYTDDRCMGVCRRVPTRTADGKPYDETPHGAA